MVETASPISALDPKLFYRKMEAVFREVATFGASEPFARSFMDRFWQHLAHLLGVRTAHLYEVDGAATLLCSWGRYASDLSDQLEVLRELRADFPWIGNFEGLPAAVLPVSAGTDFLGVFVLDHPDTGEPELASVFSALRYAISLNLQRLELQDTLEQARAIQTSLLPDTPPQFSDFQIAAVTLPAHSVGGDIYDFHALSPGVLALALGDASGHGLPAALQARDVITGLRMGWAPDMNLVSSVERLNTVIHRSGLGSRFVSLVAGLLHEDGAFRYLNAGHPSPLLLDSSGFRELKPTGMILGPFPWSRFQEESVRLEPGCMLAFYSDGVLERSNGTMEFGSARLRSWMEDWRRGPVEAAVADLDRRMREFGEGLPAQDDATVLLVRRFSS